MIGIVPDIFLKIDVYYEVYMTKELRDSLGIDLTYTLSRIEFTGDVTEVTWDPGGERRLKVEGRSQEPQAASIAASRAARRCGYPGPQARPER